MASKGRVVEPDTQWGESGMEGNVDVDPGRSYSGWELEGPREAWI